MNVADHSIPRAVRTQVSVFAVTRQTDLVVEADRCRQQSQDVGQVAFETVVACQECAVRLERHVRRILQQQHQGNNSA